MRRVACVLWMVGAALAAAGTAAGQTDDIRVCNRVEEPFASAIAACTRLVGAGRLSPTELATVYTNRGTAHRLLGQYDRALQDQDEAVRLNPRNSRAWHNRGVALYYSANSISRSSSTFGRAIAIDDRFGSILRESRLRLLPQGSDRSGGRRLGHGDEFAAGKSHHLRCPRVRVAAQGRRGAGGRRHGRRAQAAGRRRRNGRGTRPRVTRRRTWIAGWAPRSTTSRNGSSSRCGLSSGRVARSRSRNGARSSSSRPSARRLRARSADAAPPLPRRLAFQELHRRRHPEAARAGPAAARRSGRPAMSTACIRRSPRRRCSSCRTAPASSATARCRPIGRPPAVPRAAELRADLADAARRSRPTRASNTPISASPCSAWSIEAVTGEPYADWIKREVVDAAGLARDPPDMPLPRGRRLRAATAAGCCSAAASSIPGDQLDPRAGAGRRLRQHRRRSGAASSTSCRRRRRRASCRSRAGAR